MAKILIIDDEKSIRNALRDILEYEKYEVDEAADGAEGYQKIIDGDYDVVLCDIKMPKMDGMEILDKVSGLKPDLPMIMITGHGSIETAVEATKTGAYDFIPKPPDMNRLLVSLRNALERTDLVQETKVLKRRISKTREISGKSPAIRRILDTIERVAPTDARVLITGENGTGKELVARWIHEKSSRTNGPLVEVNCAAIPSELIESELFGHEKGSFTSAIRQHTGKFEQANGGTLFLDEIGDMSLSAQAKVLRVLQENKVTRVGGDKEIQVDVRIVAATNKDLSAEIEKGNFREDLYHRLSVILIHVPSLQDRREDIPVLAEQFVAEISDEYSKPKMEITRRAMDELIRLDWAGNIRELRNVIERLVILCDKQITDVDVVNFAVPRKYKRTDAGIYDLFGKLQDFKDYVEKEFIDRKLRKHNWNITKAAEEVDIQRSHLYNKIEKYGLKREDMETE
jgi:DNA-binding NtrC family response regulator